MNYSDYIVSIEDLCKNYRTPVKGEGFGKSLLYLIRKQEIIKEALSDFNMLVKYGDCLGLIGPNGAGKTTLIKLMTGIISPTSGKINVLGFVPNKMENSFKMKIALVSGQKSQLFFDLTALDSFSLLQEIYSIRKDEYKQTVQDLADILKVNNLLEQPIRNLSLGERMKMELIAALIHNPPILFLDEPTIGLDCVSQNNLRIYLKEINKKKGTTIILTSHDFNDVKEICNRCIVINKGKKISDSSADELIKKYNSKKVISIYFKNNNCLMEFNCNVPQEVMELTHDKIKIAVAPSDVEKVYHCILANRDVIDYSIEDEDISSIIERVYDDDK